MDKGKKQEVKHKIWELRQMQEQSLEMKIALTRDRIRSWYRHWGGEVYVSFSGGKDSTVLLHLVREMYPDVPAVFVNTGLEYPEVQKFAKSFENVEVLRPKMTFHEVIRKYGYPIHCIGGGEFDTDGLWKPSKNGLGMGHVFDELNKVYGKDFIRY